MQGLIDNEFLINILKASWLQEIVLLCFERFLPWDYSQFLRPFFLRIHHHPFPFSTFGRISGAVIASLADCVPYRFEFSGMILQIGDEAQLFGNVQKCMSHFLQTLHMEVSAVGSRLIYPESSSCFLWREGILLCPEGVLLCPEGILLCPEGVLLCPGWHLMGGPADEISDIEFHLFRRRPAIISGLGRRASVEVAWRCEGEDRYSIESIASEELVDVQLAGPLGGAHGEKKLMMEVGVGKEELVVPVYHSTDTSLVVAVFIIFYFHNSHLQTNIPSPHSHYFRCLLKSKLSFLMRELYNSYNVRIMLDNFRVVECLHTPSVLFAIYDYTKLAYLTGHYLCLREVINPDARPTFIPLQNPASVGRYFGIAAFPNCLVLAQQSSSKDIMLHFYQQEESHLRYISELSRRSDPETPVTMQLHHSNRYIYVAVRRDMDLEVVVIDIATKMFLGRAFINGDAVQFRVKNVDHLQQFSVALRDVGQVVELQVVFGKPQEGMRIVEKGRWEMGSSDAVHCWAKDELIIMHSDTVFVYLQGKLVESIPAKGMKIMEQTISGFLLASSSRLIFMKKNNNCFEAAAEYDLQQQPNKRVMLSPQEDMIAFYCNKKQAIFYAHNFERGESLQRRCRLALQCIHHENKKIKAFNSPQSLVVISSQSSINIYSPISFHCYISVKIESHQASKTNDSQKRRLMRSTTMMPQRVVFTAEQGEVIDNVGIHPVSSIIGVAFKNAVKVYQVLYSQLKVVKEILISHCKEVGFNRSGSVMYCKVSGKQGSKIYLYNTLNNYEYMEILSSNRPIDAVRFSQLDHIIYGVHQHGYYFWSLQSMFKQRGENTTEIGFSVRGGDVYLNQLLLWGQNEILLIEQSGNRQGIKLSRPVSNLLVQQSNILISTADGSLFRCKGFQSINAQLAAQGFRIFQNSQLFTIKTNSVLLCLSQEGNILCVEWGNEDKNHHQVISIQRRKIVKYQEKYHQYEDHMSDLQERLGQQLQLLQAQFCKRQEQQRLQFTAELADREDRYLSMRAQKLKLEQSMQENLRAHEQETMQQVKQLEKMYERKIAVTTNKLLTSEEIAFRNHLLARQNLQSLQLKHFEDIRGIRQEYSKDLTRQFQAGDKKDQLFAIKRQYQTRLSQLQQENENLLKRFQSMTETNIVNLKKNVVNLELKYSQEVSQKVNLQKQFGDKLIELQVFRAKNEYLQGRLNQQLRRGQQLSREYARVEGLAVQKDQAIGLLQKRVIQLEKSNEIFKYRIIEMKGVSDPKEEEILKLKDNMIELEEQYEKITKKAHQYQQNIALLKKDIAQTKNQLATALQKQRKIDKSYGTVIDKVRQATKAPIQQIRKMLIKILEPFDHPVQGKALQQKRSNSPLGQLNRVREHLQICLMEVVQTGKKNEKHKNVQISRKNRENSELLREINDLRVRVRELQGTLKDRQLQLQELNREGKSSSFKMGRGYDRVSTNFDSESRQLVKNRTKESFFEKSMFKGYWREKRLKTEQGSRKKSSHSLMKQQTNNLYIQSKGEEVEELRRLLQQKQTIIKQLINKIHKLS